MFRIRRFGIMKTATVVAVMYMLIVAVFVVPFVLIALVVTPSDGSGALGGVAGILVGGFAAIFIYGFFGWVFTAIAAAVYNLAAGWVGGIEVQVEAVAPPPPVPAWGTPPPSSTLPPPTEPWTARPDRLTHRGSPGSLSGHVRWAPPAPHPSEVLACPASRRPT